VGGCVVALTAEGEAHGFDAGTGRPLWRAPLPGFGASEFHTYKAPVGIADGLVIAAAATGPVLLLNPQTGTIAAKCPVSGTDRYYAVPCVKDGRVYVAARDQTACYDLRTGEVVWRTDTKKYGSRGVGSPFLFGGEIIHGTTAYTLAFNCATGAVRALAGPRPAGGWAVSVPAARDGWLFSAGNPFVAVETKTAEVRWKRELAPGRKEVGFSSPALSGDWLYLGTDTGDLCAVAVNTGDVVWRFCVGVPVKSSPVISGNMLFVKDYDGNLHAFVGKAGARR
jgi:outer membrane protein assembly factor BamB